MHIGGVQPLKLIKKHWQLYVVLLIPLTFLIIFSYIPMGGIILAFKDYKIRAGILGSPWAGFKYFNMFFRSPDFWLLLKNTLGISVYSIIAGFPLPVLLALSLNEVRKAAFKKTVQMVTYAPYFISTVVMVGMIMQFLDMRSGLVNKFLEVLGIPAVNFMGEPAMFKSIYVWTNIWQFTGYNAIIYIAALAGISPTLYEAAYMDGASKFQKIRYIDLPGIAPTIVITLILSVGSMMNIGFEKIFLMQNNLNSMTSDIIATYVYRVGLINGQYSYTTAIGLFNSFINMILLASVNAIARKVGETSLW